MSVKAAIKNICSISILDYARMLTMNPTTISDCVQIIHHYSNKTLLESLTKRAYKFLYEKNLETATFTDEEGNRFAVKFVQNNVKVYDETDEYVRAVEALEVSKKWLEEVKERTPFEMSARGEMGYYYKTCKPE